MTKKTNLDQIEQALFDSVFSNKDSFFAWEDEFCPKCDSNQAETKTLEDGTDVFFCYTCGYRTESIEVTTTIDDLRREEEEQK